MESRWGEGRSHSQQITLAGIMLPLKRPPFDPYWVPDVRYFFRTTRRTTPISFWRRRYASRRSRGASRAASRCCFPGYRERTGRSSTTVLLGGKRKPIKECAKWDGKNRRVRGRKDGPRLLKFSLSNSVYSPIGSRLFLSRKTRPRNSRIAAVSVARIIPARAIRWSSPGNLGRGTAGRPPSPTNYSDDDTRGPYSETSDGLSSTNFPTARERGTESNRDGMTPPAAADAPVEGASRSRTTSRSGLSRTVRHLELNFGQIRAEYFHAVLGQGRGTDPHSDGVSKPLEPDYDVSRKGGEHASSKPQSFLSIFGMKGWI